MMPQYMGDGKYEINFVGNTNTYVVIDTETGGILYKGGYRHCVLVAGYLVAGYSLEDVLKNMEGK
jgi:hypothetical protein